MSGREPSNRPEQKTPNMPERKTPIMLELRTVNTPTQTTPSQPFICLTINSNGTASRQQGSFRTVFFSDPPENDTDANDEESIWEELSQPQEDATLSSRPDIQDDALLLNRSDVPRMAHVIYGNIPNEAGGTEETTPEIVSLPPQEKATTVSSRPEIPRDSLLLNREDVSRMAYLLYGSSSDEAAGTSLHRLFLGVIEKLGTWSVEKQRVFELFWNEMMDKEERDEAESSVGEGSIVDDRDETVGKLRQDLAVLSFAEDWEEMVGSVSQDREDLQDSERADTPHDVLLLNREDVPSMVHIVYGGNTDEPTTPAQGRLGS